MGFFPVRPSPVIPTTDILSFIFDDPIYPTHKPILVDAADPSRSISHAQAVTYVRQLIAGLHALGVRPDDCVCLHSFNDILYPLLGLAVIGLGGIHASSNPAYTPLELSHHFRITQTKFLITEPELLPAVRKAALENSIPTSHILIFHPLPTQSCPPGFTSWLTLLNHGARPWLRFNDLTTAKTTTAARLTSSGTTGLPKACINTHYGLVAQHMVNWSPKYWADLKDYTPVHLWSLPMFHAAIMPRVFMTVFKTGDTAYIMRRFALENFVRYLREYAVTDTFFVPPMVVAIVQYLKEEDERPDGRLKGLRCAIVGAAPLSSDMQNRLLPFMEKGRSCFAQGWGMTESNCVIASFEYPEGDQTGSVGFLRPGVEAKLVDDEGVEVRQFGVRGEMCVKGDIVFPGYFGNEDANKVAFDAEGYYKTGDVMYCDGATGKWYIVDRKKELIKVRGFQVAPPELEGCLMGMPDVVDVAVIGVKDSSGESEVPRAYVVKKQGSQATEDDVKRWVEGRLAKFKRLDGGVVFIDAVPKVPSGKILKRLLRERAAIEMGGEQSKL